jgi:hypothetical protein
MEHYPCRPRDLLDSLAVRAPLDGGSPRTRQKGQRRRPSGDPLTRCFLLIGFYLGPKWPWALSGPRPQTGPKKIKIRQKNTKKPNSGVLRSRVLIRSFVYACGARKARCARLFLTHKYDHFVVLMFCFGRV